MSNPAGLRALHWIGGALGAAGVLFVALRLKGYAGELNLGRFSAYHWAAFGLLTFTYGAANGLLVHAWRSLLLFLGVSVSLPWAFRAYGISQLAKYVPGNVTHLVARQALALAAGLPGWAIAKSAAWELGLLAVAGALLGTLALPLLHPGSPAGIEWVVFVVVVTMAGAVASRVLGEHVLRALVSQIAFLAIAGALFTGTLIMVSPGALELSIVPTISAAYVISWLAGLITPGAPAGIGVREVALLFLLDGRLSEADLLLVVLLGRMVTVGGDLAFFACAWASNLWNRPHAVP
ncbi:MAG TPA: hypothetical protein VMN03_05620 [Burkholderiales bacterium]|nr:hypothetical protein [Burkholderiales bacterium]